jgi:hypothetical protein
VVSAPRAPVTFATPQLPGAGRAATDGLVQELAELPTSDIGDLEIAGDQLFWIERYHRSVWTVPRGGGAKRFVASVQERPGELAASPQALYWTEHGRFRSPSGSLKRVALPLPPSGPVVGEALVRGLQSPTALQRADNRLWWLDIHHGRVETARGRVRQYVAASGKGRPHTPDDRRLAVDDTHAYYAQVPAGHVRDDESLMRMSLRGGLPETLVQGLDQMAALAVGPTHVWWAARGNGGLRLQRWSKSRASRETLADGLQTVHRIVLDAQHAYFNEVGSDLYRIVRVERATGRRQTVIEGQRRAWHIAVDATHLYWIEGGHVDGECRRPTWPHHEHVEPELECDGPEARMLRMPKPAANARLPLRRR